MIFYVQIDTKLLSQCSFGAECRCFFGGDIVLFQATDTKLSAYHSKYPVTTTKNPHPFHHRPSIVTAQTLNT